MTIPTTMSTTRMMNYYSIVFILSLIGMMNIFLVQSFQVRQSSKVTTRFKSKIRATSDRRRRGFFHFSFLPSSSSLPSDRIESTLSAVSPTSTYFSSFTNLDDQKTTTDRGDENKNDSSEDDKDDDDNRKNNDDDTKNGEQQSTFPKELFEFPRHSHPGVNGILLNTESVVKSLNECHIEGSSSSSCSSSGSSINAEEFKSNFVKNDEHDSNNNKEKVIEPIIYANTYVDLAKIDVVGFDYDYTLVTYTNELLELIYEMALKRLVTDRNYPDEMLRSGLQFDPSFSIRGLAVDKKTGWICHLSYTYKVAVAWEGREKVPTSRVYTEYRRGGGNRKQQQVLRPSDRKKRFKPLNDLFSMSECCLISDTIQYFKDRSDDIPFCPQNVVSDVLACIRETHISGDFHKIVANDPEKYYNPVPNLKEVLGNLKDSGKRLIFVSNSPFWYVDAGMRYIIGPEWKHIWDTIITSAGKPNFYTNDSRPFREVNQDTGRLKFEKVESFEPGAVYTEGCLRELNRLMNLDNNDDDHNNNNNANSFSRLNIHGVLSEPNNSNVLYIGDSMFADLVDAKREYGWITAAVTPEVEHETNVMMNQPEYILSRKTINLLLQALRMIQDELGSTSLLRFSEEDKYVLDSLEKLVSKWRDQETSLLGNNFGSVFSARYQPSLFAHSLRRYCDLYMSKVSNLRFYSPHHRFYPEQQNARFLAHEIAELRHRYKTTDSNSDENRQ